MHQHLERRRIDIVAACRRHRVVRLDVFGSGARSLDFDPGRSDADFLVDFDEGYGVDEYLGLKEDLERVLGLPVDLVTRRGLESGPGGRLTTDIATDGELVYER